MTPVSYRVRGLTQVVHAAHHRRPTVAFAARRRSRRPGRRARGARRAQRRGQVSLLRCVYRTYLPDSGSVALRTADGAARSNSPSCPTAPVAALRGREIRLRVTVPWTHRRVPVRWRSWPRTAAAAGWTAPRRATPPSMRSAAQHRRGAVGRRPLGALRRRTPTGQPRRGQVSPAAAAAARRAGVRPRPGQPGGRLELIARSPAGRRRARGVPRPGRHAAPGLPRGAAG